MEKAKVSGYDAVVVGSGYGGSVAACRLSTAGVNVCLIEKGRRWEAQDFPTDSLKIISALRVESSKLGASFGPKNALFQVHIQEDALLSVACGLGGGSLVNAGVLLPAPVKARRNPKWPKDWERDWESCEASASSMLRIQKAPVKFQSARTMGDVIGQDLEETPLSSMKLSVNFDVEEPVENSKQMQKLNSCLACGNCLTGCPYNAKISTDKTYLHSAIQAGCTVKTECEVQCIVENPFYAGKEGNVSCRSFNRRWFVFFNETDYMTADFVILSAGVLGTSKILFQSQMRGLRLSERLGSGISCNGNTVAYLAGSPAPLNGYGLDKRQLSKIPFQQRPGPSISSSYTSSTGFTIQSAVLPTAYIYLLFKGIYTYGWPPGFWFLHGILDKLKSLFGLKSSQAIILCGVGYDESNGSIAMDSESMKLKFSTPHDPLLPKKVEAFQKLTKKLGGILFMSRYRSTSVHLLGGCNASSNSSDGVCNQNGQVYDLKTHGSVHPGLYVCDASLIPCSVGINPSLTIATAAEHVSRNLLKDVLSYKAGEEIGVTPKFADQPDSATYPGESSPEPGSSTVVVRETMRGYIGGMPCMACLKMKINSCKQQKFDEDSMAIMNSNQLLTGKVGGYVVFKAVAKDKLHIIDGEVNLCEVDYRTPYTQYMHYRLLLAAPSGSRYILEGKKILNPFLFALNAWRESTTMQVTFKRVTKNAEMENLKGELSISIMELLKSILSLKGSKRAEFICHFAQSLLRTYILQAPRVTLEDLPLPQKGPYPSSTHHDLKTEDGFIISCKEWKCDEKAGQLEGKRKNPILLLNGYAGDSFCLPTEPNDLVRTLLKEGHDVWLLLPRLHPLNPSNNFTIDDMGKYDIPSVIDRIQEVHGPSTKVHVVSHCVGGLAIHIALMGGHVSPSRIASLSCANSSMFFKLTALSKIKLWLPLIPLSMKILGKNTILPMSETLEASRRHCLLKSIARFIPRYERCMCKECGVLSGIFGNAYWHKNISPALHHWLNKEILPSLPMAAFPHIRKICVAGYIVDRDGNNSYLIHPERMALSTLYISGGRTIMATPETSFLANKYMKLHQPGFKHDRLVVDGFGHSDLLIGQDAPEEVFPHILSHITSAEEGKHIEARQCSKESLDWGCDVHELGNGFLGSWLSPIVTIWFIVLLFVCLFLFC